MAIACAIVASAVALHPAVTQAEPLNGNLSIGDTYSNPAGAIGYEFYVPPSYQAGTPMPLVIALHGCTQTAAQFRTLSHLDDLAAADGFIVAYPEQTEANNSLRCWNWFTDANVNRAAGEPSLIAGLTLQLESQYSVDPRHVSITGLSAGGAMASVMAATYPDLYSAVGVGSGCEYTAGAACAGYKSADPEQAGKRAYEAMGAFARPVPFIVFQGDQDKTVPPVNADQLVRTQQITADWADDGQENHSVPSAAVKTVSGKSKGGRSYTVKYYSDGHGHELGEYWVIKGMGHAWSGGDPSAQYSDAAGPDESEAMYDFFATHPLGDPGPALGGNTPTGPITWPPTGWPTSPTTGTPTAPTGWPAPPTGWPTPTQPASPLPWPPHSLSKRP
ncbi:PHB depolymerase family esterase [Solirubrobacter ginsenosidimutans]|uniref:PHB depolymerase family esterase n=1 Tax=Solirubrobacter ginsenosidimutans TaxID=490573 RepID=A0A9X3S4C8_9ACTN|nr:PHB depolymerase family esterase [Solirubrobacter ginsenosidimutans]MDA0165659.1 PHB depolymerase family esterase [Solirubrobacter ginsenosidimutans]